jgi:predicted carbohydrate-binding protein with CBM5 and CBM33 domain
MWQGYSTMSKDNNIKSGAIEFDAAANEFDWSRVSKREWNKMKPLERDDFDLSA